MVFRCLKVPALKCLIFLYSSAHRPMFLCPKIIKPLKWAYFELVWWTRPNKEKEGRRTVLRGAQLGPSMSLLPHNGQKCSILFWSELMKTYLNDDEDYSSWRWPDICIFWQFVKKWVQSFTHIWNLKHLQVLRWGLTFYVWK